LIFRLLLIDLMLCIFKFLETYIKFVHKNKEELSHFFLECSNAFFKHCLSIRDWTQNGLILSVIKEELKHGF